MSNTPNLHLVLHNLAHPYTRDGLPEIKIDDSDEIVVAFKK